MTDVTLKDIADAVGVSIVTVSNALSGKKGVSESVRRQVEDAAKKLGYDSAKYNRKESGYRIGVIVSDIYLEIGVSFYWAMYQHVAYMASKSQSVTMLEVLLSSGQERLELPKMVREKNIDGLIVIGWVQRAYIDKLVSAAKVPIVLLDFGIKGLPCDAVMSSNYVGMYKITRYLLEKGHRDIAFVGSIFANENIMDRYYGYCKALGEAGIRIRKEWLLEDRDVKTGDMQVAIPENMPTAFACNSDLTASCLYETLKERGYRIPLDVSIAGYDNYLFGNNFSEELTTYNVDMKQMAGLAVKLLRDKIKGKEKYHSIRYVDSVIVERSSVRTMQRFVQ